jgi:hypothetical protein
MTEDGIEFHDVKQEVWRRDVRRVRQRERAGGSSLRNATAQAEEIDVVPSRVFAFELQRDGGMSGLRQARWNPGSHCGIDHDAGESTPEGETP